LASPDLDIRRLSAVNAAHVRHGTATPPQVAADLAAARLALYITKIVDAAPPLSAAQRDKLALLLRGGQVA
jgi:hypothetical protein